uniref:Uncharacterized protein n=1 Tax=Anopheles culicifacies TaxID=139723 RepID=A0A182MH66_9DIPT
MHPYSGIVQVVPLSEAAPVPTDGLSFSFALRRFFTITSRQKMRQAEMAAATHPNAAYIPPGSSISRLPHSCSLSSYPDGQFGRPVVQRGTKREGNTNTPNEGE